MRACVKGHGAAGDDGGGAELSGTIVEGVKEMSAERACHRKGGWWSEASYARGFDKCPSRKSQPHLITTIKSETEDTRLYIRWRNSRARYSETGRCRSLHTTLSVSVSVNEHPVRNPP